MSRIHSARTRTSPQPSSSRYSALLALSAVAIAACISAPRAGNAENVLSPLLGTVLNTPGPNTAAAAVTNGVNQIAVPLGNAAGLPSLPSATSAIPNTFSAPLQSLGASNSLVSLPQTALQHINNSISPSALINASSNYARNIPQATTSTTGGAADVVLGGPGGTSPVRGTASRADHAHGAMVPIAKSLASSLPNIAQSPVVWHAPVSQLPGLQNVTSSNCSALSGCSRGGGRSTIVQIDGAVIRDIGSGVTELTKGALLVAGAKSGPVKIITPLADVLVRKDADVIVKLEHGLLRVQNLDGAHSGVEVHLPSGKVYAPAAGFEFVTSGSPLTKGALLPADGVARRGLVIASDANVAVGELQLAGVIRSQIKPINLREYPEAKGVLNRVLKTAAVIQVARGAAGFVPGALPPVGLPPITVPPIIGEIPPTVPGGLPELPPVVPNPPLVPSSEASNVPSSSGGIAENIIAVSRLESVSDSANFVVPRSVGPVTAGYDSTKQPFKTPPEEATGVNTRRPVTKRAQADEKSAKPPIEQNGPETLPEAPKADDQRNARKPKALLADSSSLPENSAEPAAFNRPLGSAESAPSPPSTSDKSLFESPERAVAALRETVRAFPELAILAMLLIASLLILSLVLARSALIRARQVQAMNDRLEKEVQERRQIEQQVKGLNTDLERRLEELASLNKELGHARDQALQASKLKSQFVANISHEIRTPISAVIGMNQLLLSTPLDSRQREYSRLVHESAQSLLTVINDILDFSKIEAGMMDLNISDFSTHSLLKEVADMISATVRQKNLLFVSTVDANVPAVLSGDANRLRQVLVNLVGNAAKFTTTGEITLHVAMTSEAPDMVRFSVTDSGIGISPEAQTKLFQPFVQEDGSTTRRFGGTGLGLSISKRLVELMGGTINLRSKPQHGASFWFDVPLPAVTDKASQDAAAGQSPEAPAVVVQQDLAAAPKVLIVSNQPNSPLLLKNQLNSVGYDAIIASSANSASSMLREQVFDAVVLDMATGGSLASDLKENPTTAAIPIIGLQANDIPPGENYNAVVNSPFNTVDVVRWINSLLKHEMLAPEAPLSGQAAAVTPTDCPLPANAKILVAEDSPVLQQMVRLLFGKLGCQIDLVTNGKEAVDAASKGDYALIFMDWQMPEMDGLEATRNIRDEQNKKLVHTPIIAMTANAMQGDKEICMSAGMDDYISKPFTFEQLKSVVQKWAPDSFSSSS